MIDTEATRQRFIDTGRTAAAWGRSHGFVSTTVNELIRGAFPITGDVGKKIVAAMERDGLLVWTSDKKAA